MEHTVIAAIKYKDKARERQRQANLGKATEERQKKQKAREAKQAERERLEKERKKEKDRRDKQSVRQRADEHFEYELAELNREARLLKQLKKGSITEREFQVWDTSSCIGAAFDVSSYMLPMPRRFKIGQQRVPTLCG